MESEIKNVAVLDLTGAASQEVLDGITRISHVATILVPESLVAKLSKIPMDKVAATVPVPDGKKVSVLSGQMTLSGEALAKPDAQDEVLILSGQLVITTPVLKVGYGNVMVFGQLLAPTGSEAALGAGITRMSGQVMYYPYSPATTVKMLTGDIRLSGTELANPNGQPSDVLAAFGLVVIVGPVERVGIQQLIAFGQVIAPKGSEAALAGRVTAIGSGVVYYEGTPRVFNGSETFAGRFFDLLDDNTTLVLNGSFELDDDVSPDAVHRKLAGLVLNGNVTAPRAVVPVLQALSIVHNGKIVARDAG